jgi:P-type E1-E2 ATPase
MGVVLINAAIGFVQEGKAEQALASIRQMLSLKARARRDRHPGRALMPPNWCRAISCACSAGDRVPADLRLLEVSGLQVEESPLTGESEAVEKSNGSRWQQTLHWVIASAWPTPAPS